MKNENKTLYEKPNKKPNQNVTVNCDNLCLKADTEREHRLHPLTKNSKY